MEIQLHNVTAAVLIHRQQNEVDIVARALAVDEMNLSSPVNSLLFQGNISCIRLGWLTDTVMEIACAPHDFGLR